MISTKTNSTRTELIELLNAFSFLLDCYFGVVTESAFSKGMLVMHSASPVPVLQCPSSDCSKLYPSHGWIMSFPISINTMSRHDMESLIEGTIHPKTSATYRKTENAPLEPTLHLYNIVLKVISDKLWYLCKERTCAMLIPFV